MNQIKKLYKPWQEPAWPEQWKGVSEPRQHLDSKYLF